MRIEKLRKQDIKKMTDTELHYQREQFVQIFDKLWKGECWPGISKDGFIQKYSILLDEMDGRNLGIKPRDVDVTLLSKSLAEVGKSADDRVDVLKPFPGEHACRINDPDKYDKIRRVNDDREHDDKDIDVLYGIIGDTSEMQALRYDKDEWTAASAKAHCKDNDGTFEEATEVEKFRIIKSDAPERIVLGIVAEPDEVDSQGDQQNAEEIEKAMNWYMETAQGIVVNTDENHDNDDFSAILLQNYVTLTDMSIDGEVIKKGSWLQALRLDEETWEKIENEEITGFSMAGTARRIQDTE